MRYLEFGIAREEAVKFEFQINKEYFFSISMPQVFQRIYLH